MANAIFIDTIGNNRPWLNRCSRWLLPIYWPLLALATHWPRVNTHQFDPAMLPIEPLRQFATFAVLTGLLCGARIMGQGASHRVNVITGAMIALVYAMTDEWTQGWFVRQVDPVDFVLNALAVVMMATALWSPTRPWRWTWTWLMRWLLVASGCLLCVLALDKLWQPPTWIYHWPGFGLSREVDGRVHLYGSAWLTAIALMAMPLGMRRPGWSAVAVIAVMLAAGPSLEYIQKLYGHDFELKDVYVDYWGTGIGLAAYLLWLGLIHALPITTHTHGEKAVGDE